MNNIFTKKFVLIFFSIFLISLAVFFACKKIDELGKSPNNTSKLMQFYNSALINSFRNEPIAKDFLQEVSRIPIKVVNGILSFNSVEDMNKVYDLIIDYTDKSDEFVSNDANYSKYGESEQMPVHIMSYLFESKLGFYSLRAEIEEQLVQMERGDGISDNDDPNDHYTVSPYWRTILTPQCELILDDLICVYYDTYGIGIMNLDWKTLDELHRHQSKNNFDEIKALEFCSGKQNAFFLTTGTEATVSAEFSYIVDKENPCIVQFLNYSYSEAYKDMDFLWDFGDGTTSTEKNPKHRFATLGVEYTVSLTVKIDNSKAQSGTTTHIIQSAPNFIGYISYQENNNGNVAFSINNIGSYGISKVTWSFGDNTQQEIFPGLSASHKYSNNGYYDVSAEILYNDLTTREVIEATIQVKNISGGGGNCCARSIDREVEKDGNPYTYNGESRRVKQVIRVTNIFGFHRIAATTKNLFQNANGKWKARKVQEINAGAVGTIYWDDNNCSACQCPFIYNQWKGGEASPTVNPKKNASEAVMDRGTDGFAFKVGPKTMWSQHYVKDGKVWMNRVGDVAVHDRPCD